MSLENTLLFIPKFSLHNDELFIYNEVIRTQPKIKYNEKSISNLKDNTQKGKISKSAEKRAKRAIKYLIYNAVDKKVYNPKFNSSYVFKVNFITLTLSSKQLHSSNEIKSSLLNQFLVEARKRWGLHNYVWKAEFQKNGNIHFHILSDVFIPHNELRQVWNRIQEKLGYVSAYKKTNHKQNPNSTDIHSLRKIKNVPAYVLKYMIKDGGSSEYKGNIWRCSQSLSHLTGYNDIVEREFEEEIIKLRNLKGTKEYIMDYVSCYYFDSEVLTYENFPYLCSALRSYLATIFPQEKEIQIF
jgi:hypothetical protein